MSKYQEETSSNSNVFWFLIWVGLNYYLSIELINSIEGSYINQFPYVLIPALLIFGNAIVLIFRGDEMIDMFNDILDNKVGFKIVIKRREDD